MKCLILVTKIESLLNFGVKPKWLMEYTMIFEMCHVEAFASRVKTTFSPKAMENFAVKVSDMLNVFFLYPQVIQGFLQLVYRYSWNYQLEFQQSLQAKVSILCILIWRKYYISIIFYGSKRNRSSAKRVPAHVWVQNAIYRCDIDYYRM